MWHTEVVISGLTVDMLSTHRDVVSASRCCGDLGLIHEATYSTDYTLSALSRLESFVIVKN